MAYLGNKPDAFQYTSTSSQSLSGNGVTTTFTLSRQVSANADIEVVVNNVPQEPGFAYYVSDLTNLIFTAAPSAAANNIYIIYRNYVQSGIAPGANTVTTSAIAANTIQPWQLTNSLLNPTVNTFTANGTGTTYTLSFAPPSANAVVVTVNGITQNFPENYSTNDTVLTFTDPPASNSVIRVLQQAMIGTSIVPIDGSVTTSKLASGLTLSGSTTLTGNLTVAGTTTLSGGVNIDSNTLYIDNVNNLVGIGTSSPASLLHVVGGTIVEGTDRITLRRAITPSGAGTTLSAVQFAAISTGTTYVNGALILSVSEGAWSSTSTPTNLTFRTTPSASVTAAERMRIDSSGNVGIGLTTPTQKLEVTGSIKLNSGVVIGERGTAGAPAYSFSDDTDTGMFNISNLDLGFSVGGTERLRIDSSGNVGIGVAPFTLAGLSNTSALDIQSGPQILGFGNNLYLSSNAYYNSGWLLKAASGAMSLQFQSSTQQFNIYGAASGAAGGSASWVNILEGARNKTIALQGGSSSSGTGIAFPATQSASSDANTLDDYEEGTFTPTWTRDGGNPSYTLSSGDTGGRYTKIGNLVTVSFELRTSAISSNGSGAWEISSLPFTSNASFPRSFGAIGRFYNGGEITGIRFQMDNNVSKLRFFTTSTDTAYSAAPSGSIVIMQGTISYQV